ncbi:hypothetical protein FOVG_16331 [Fusarium oxysporum f. sp. pisi HDV247]|uniref:Rhodopsin domain-containing protein n=1 Tax=Fusarium oxysporum f. sp. pisi HDV247 TaxID=1080344 RepID=W9NXN7_FUSOX|nr:hypothetical protein FOVG_16331 [Fusarium oxysporum f. sp. pisi HDV247]
MTGNESVLRDSDDSKVSMVIGVATFLLATSTLMVVLRVVSRAMVKQFRLDDMAAIASLLTMIACGTAITSMTRFGLGRHISTVSSKNQILYLRCFWVSVFFYMLSLFFIKMSFLINYYRLLSASKLRPYCIGAMVLIVLWGSGVCILVFVMCIPLAGVWDPNVDAQCVPHITIMWWFNGVFNSIGDLFILTLPIPALWRLQLPRRQKAYLLFVFSLGFLTVGISIARMRWLKMDADMTWWNVTPALWSLGELTSAISCSCLPFFKPLALRVKSFMSHATVGGTYPQMTGGEGDKEANAHSSVSAGQKEFIQNSNLMFHIPIISDILSDLGIGEPSLLDLFRWIAAVAYKVVYKIAHDSAPFPDNDDVNALINADSWHTLQTILGQPPPQEELSYYSRAASYLWSAPKEMSASTKKSISLCLHSIGGTVDLLNVFAIPLEADGSSESKQNSFSGPMSILNYLHIACHIIAGFAVPQDPISNEVLKAMHYRNIAVKVVAGRVLKKYMKADGTNRGFPALDKRGMGALVNVVVGYWGLFVTAGHLYELSHGSASSNRTAAILMEVGSILGEVSSLAYCEVVNDPDRTTREVPLLVLAGVGLIETGLELSLLATVD